MSVIMSEHDYFAPKHDERCSVCDGLLAFPHAYPIVWWDGKKDLFICRHCISIAPGLMADLVQAHAIEEMARVHPLMKNFSLERVGKDQIKRRLEERRLEAQRLPRRRDLVKTVEQLLYNGARR